ncbi:putative non-heme dioxygenase domain, isopenicillin N synthase [Helianthus annuus]|nr:putative non-heme dioxygenase domain, isopenicillin N synthase [Helianthus annuus]
MHVSLSYQLVLERLNMKYVQSLAESPNLHYVPSIYAYAANSTEPPASDLQDAIPTIDFSLLTSADPDLRSKMIQELDMACKDWGFFRVGANLGVQTSRALFLKLELGSKVIFQAQARLGLDSFSIY